ncbi:MAG: FecR domain-containing protein [Paucibacter sp.]|nr:FecR domain-containing protein [Roseateles sp.]
MTSEIAAEAAVWIARLHGPDRSPLMERECLAWQTRSAAHRLAFERCTDVWEAVPGVRLADAFASAAPRRSASGAAGAVGRMAGLARRRWTFASMVAVLIAGAGVSIYLWDEGGAFYATKVGEQQLVLLDDGTRMSLNTDTQVRVKMDAARRMVKVLAGEALFEVAKDAHRPFVVRVADSEVEALGTVFSVRLAGSDGQVAKGLAVTLIEGQVTVRPASAGGTQGIAPAKPVLMQPGERIRLVKSNGSASQQVDRPHIEQMVAWKRSEAVFDDVSLLDAVTEMNRYNRTPIVLLGDASLAQLRVSGLYRTGDSAGFARAVAALHGLNMREHGGRLELAPPQ